MAPEAIEDLDLLRSDLRAEVRDAIEKFLRYEPTKTSKSRIKRLRGFTRPKYRLRVNEVRVFYDVVAETVEVLAIVDKATANEWLERYGEQ